MANRIKITATHEFDVGEEGVGFWLDPNNEGEAFEALTMAHALGCDGTDMLHQVIDFRVERVEEVTSGGNQG